MLLYSKILNVLYSFRVYGWMALLSMVMMVVYEAPGITVKNDH